MILILSTPEDLHARCVRQHVQRLGHSTEVLSPQDLGSTRTLSFSISDTAEAWATDGDIAAVDLGAVTAVWLRRFALPRLPSELLGQEDRAFARREWNQSLDGLLGGFEVPCMNPLMAQRSAVKPRQLSAAKRAGLRVPATLMTSNATDAQDFIDEHGGHVVLKTLSPHRSRPMYTRRWRTKDAAHLDKLLLAPAIFQEEIQGDYDVRVTVVGSHYFAARVRVSDETLDIRLRPDEPYVSFSFPEQVQRQIANMMNDLGLVFGCLDLRMTHEGELVFFEVNPQGQFLFVEAWTGLPISRAVAEFLTSG